MPSFYNTTRGPLSYTLRSGRVGGVSPKTWVEIAADEESCADIVRLVQQGFLVRKIERPAKVTPKVVEQPVEVAPAALPVVEVLPAVVEEVVPVVEVSALEEEAPAVVIEVAEEPTRKRRSRKSDAEVAQSEVPSESSAVE